MKVGSSQDAQPVAKGSVSRSRSGLLRVVLVAPRPLLTLQQGQSQAWIRAEDWGEGDSAQVLPPRRDWKAGAIEGALQVSGAPMEILPLHHPTLKALRSVLAEGCDVLIGDAYGGADGTVYLEGICGESHPLAPTDLGRLLGEYGVRLLILSACHSIPACDALHKAGVQGVVGIAEVMQEAAACSYLEVFTEFLAQGESVGAAHDRACEALCARWGVAPGEGTLPRLTASRRLKRCRLVRREVKGSTRRLGERQGSSSPPVPAARLRGRELDQVIIQRALLAPGRVGMDSPVVTLLGAGGMGKAALARGICRWCWDRDLFAAGIRFVSLLSSRIAEGDALADCLARELQVAVPDFSPDEDTTTVYRARVDALCAALGGDLQLLVVDNYEAVCDAEMQDSGLAGRSQRSLDLVAELRRRCPNLHLLITCRQASVGLDGEYVHQLQPLSREAAVDLFCDRASEVARMVGEGDLATVGAICENLDFVPQSVRLVASHIRFERPLAILEGLQETERRYHLRARPEGEPDYGRSCELALRYAFNHLSRQGKRLWTVMAGVFAGEPGRAAVRDIYGEGADIALDELMIWQVEEPEGGRHRMSESARAFGRARIAEGVLGVDLQRLQARHAAYYLAFAQEHQDRPEALEREIPDLLAGFAHVTAAKTRDEEAVRAYLLALERFLQARRHWDARLRRFPHGTPASSLPAASSMETGA